MCLNFSQEGIFRATMIAKQKVKIDRVTSLKQFMKSPHHEKNSGQVIAITDNDELIFYLVNPAFLEEHELTSNNFQDTKAHHSLYDVAQEWINQKSRLWTPRHIEEVKRRLNKDLYTYFEGMAIESIASQDVLNFIRKIESRKRFDLAHRLFRDLHSIMQYAGSTGLIEINPTDAVKGALMPHVVANQKTIQKEDLPHMLSLLVTSKFPEGKAINYAFILLTLTFVRAQELMGAKWEEFNIEERIWTIPLERMKMRKSHTVYLSDQALLVIDKIKAENFHTEYLFYNKEKFSVIKNERLINSLYKIGYKGKMTAHGFRALASTILNEQGFNPDIIERQLAHVDPNSVRRAYNRAEYIKDRNDMMQWWSNFILEQCPTFIESKQEILNL